MGEAVEVNELEQLADWASISSLGRLRMVRPKATFLATVMLEGGVVLEDEADVAPLRGRLGGVLAADQRRPLSGDSSPAITRRSVDLPPPRSGRAER